MAKMLLGKLRCVGAIRPRIPILTIPFFLLFVFISCKKGFNDYYGDKSPKGGFLYNKLKADPTFSIFTRGLERADLVQFINEGGLYTIFAPTDEAFTKYLSSNGYGSVDDVPVDNLFRILSFHIVNN